MHWITYEINGQRQLGALLPDGKQVVPLRMLGIDQEYKDMVDFITNVSEGELAVSDAAWHQEYEAALPLDRVKLLAPITRPVHDIICVGINYRSHQEETRDMFDAASSKKEEQHIYFGKRASRITGHGEQIPMHPEWTRRWTTRRNLLSSSASHAATFGQKRRRSTSSVTPYSMM